MNAAKQAADRYSKAIDQVISKGTNAASKSGTSGNRAEESMQAVNKILQDVQKSTEAVNNTFKKLQNQIDRCTESMGRYTNQQSKSSQPATENSQSSGDPFGLGTKSSTGIFESGKVANTLGRVKEKLQSIVEPAQEVNEKVQKIVQIIPKIGSVASEASQLARKGFSMIASAAKTAYAGIRKVSGIAAALIQKFSTGIPVIGRLSSALSNLGRQGNQSTGGIDNLKDSLNRLKGVIAGVLSVAAIVSFGKECLELGSDLAEVQNVVDVTFPNMSAKVDEFAKNAATQFGLSETMAKNFTGTFGSMAEAFGFSEQQALAMSTSLTGLAGDVASFYNLSQDEAYTKLKSVFTGETESLKDLGVVMTQTALDSYALANGYGKVTTKMTEAEKVSLRYAFVQEQLKNATGDFARTSDSWANQVRILNLQFDSLKATIGQGLINLFTPVIKVINSVIGRLSTLANAFKSFTELITGSKSQEGSGIGGIASDAASVAGGLNDAASAADKLSSATSAAGNAATKAAKQALGLLAFDEINKLTESTSSGSGSGSGTGSGTDTGGFSGDSVDYGNLAESTAETNALGKAMADAIQVFKDAWDTKGQLVMESWENALDSVKSLAADVGATLLEVWNDGSGYQYCENILDIVKDLGDAVDTFAEQFKDAWDDDNTGYNYIESIFDKWNDLLELIQEIGESITSVWGNGTGSDILKNWLKTCTNINNTVGNIAKQFKDAWTEANTGTNIIQNICDIVKDLSKHANNISESFEKWSSKLDFSSLLKSIEKISEAAGLIADDCGEGLEWFFESVLQPIGKWSLEEGAPAAFDTITSFLKLCDRVLDTVGPQLKEMYDNFFAPMASFAADRAIDFMSMLQDLMNNIDEDQVVEIESLGLSILGFKVIQKASELSTLAISAVKGALGTLTLTNLEVSLDLASIRLPATGVLNVSMLLEPLISGIDTFLTENLPSGITDALGGALAGMSIGGIVGSIGGPLGTAGGAIAGAIIGAIANVFINGDITFDDVVSNLFTGLGGAITGTALGFFIAGPVGAIVGSIVGGISGTIVENWDEIKKTGGSIADGVLKGITDCFTDIGTWIDEHIVTPFVDGVKELFGIHSPSTVMAEIGGYLIEGLLNGILAPFKNIESWIKKNIINPFVESFNKLFGSADTSEQNVTIGVGLKKNGWSTISKWIGSIPVLSQLIKLGKSGWSKVSSWIGKIPVLSQGLKLAKSGWKTISNWIGKVPTLSTGVKLAKKGWSTIKKWLGIDKDFSLGFKLPKIKVNWGSKTFAGFTIKYPTGFSTYATGGFPATGEMFIANEAGPEMIGKLGNKTTVANNQQIAEGIALAVGPAVYNAMLAAMRKGGDNKNINIILQGDVKKFFKAMQNEAIEYANTHHKSPFPV